jgi:2-oxoglutarate dehydrogenase E1 component
MEISFIKAYSAPASGSYTRAKRRHADAIKMVFDKDLFR